jgi:gamma-glutamylcyclotransferase (GGCT)/AIG2-like uncharacterized protein YtfP
MLYFGYGANTNTAAMDWRCPDATPIGAALLHGAVLRFRRYADIDDAPGAKVYGVLWDISLRDEQALDRFEGFPTYYVKREVTVIHAGRRVRAMAYVMRSKEYLEAPSPDYTRTLCEGYASFDLPLTQITEAVAEAERAEDARAEFFKPQQEMWEA